MIEIEQTRHIFSFFPPEGITQDWWDTSRGPVGDKIFWYVELGTAAQEGDLKKWRALRAKRPHHELKRSFARRDMTLVMGAAMGTSVEILQDTLDAGIDVNATAGGGWTALLFAAQRGESPRVVEALIAAGADVNAADRPGHTPLYWASRTLGPHGYEIAELLIAAGADVNALQEDGSTVLMTACAHNSYRVAELLLNSGADPNGKTDKGTTVRKWLEWGKARVKPGAEQEAYERLELRLLLAEF